MIFVAGSRKTTKLIGYTSDDYKCFHCDTIGRQALFQTIDRGTVFFIPLPFLKYRTYCAICSVYGCNGITELSKKEVERIHIIPVESNI